jgi:arabinofuranosyltransferase
MGRSGWRLAGLVPLLAVPAHLLWRLATYGEWLPNSYYAKVTGPWPESGLRYAASFALEYGIWVWALVFLAFAIKVLWRTRRPGRETSVHWNLAIPIAALAAHGLYYTLIVGGDHFEYRIYSHLIPLAFITFVWMLDRLDLRRSLSLALLLAFVLFSLPVGWTHWALTRNLKTREQTHKLFVPVADHWPGPFRWYARAFDSRQAWLTAHYVCTRHQEHKINCEFLRSVFPSREEGLRLPEAGYPVFAFGAVGVVSWVMPKINIIDTHGINDFVIARSPVEPGIFRMMGHDRMAPEGYVECFRPNVEIMRGRRLIVHTRAKPLTAEDIIECERRWIESVR